MNSMCEHYEQNLSAILDGETATVDVPSTLDHLAACPSCGTFYRRCRELEAAIGGVEADGEELEEAPSHVWERISDRISWSGRAARGSAWLRWAPRLAAVLLLAFGLWMVQAVDRGRGLSGLAFEGLGESTQDIEIQVGELDMTERRFVEITAEVLRADERFHRKMLEVMATVTRPELREGSEDEGSFEGGALEEGGLEEGGDRISLGESDQTLGVSEWRF